jgi:hypothetical protein
MGQKIEARRSRAARIPLARHFWQNDTPIMDSSIPSASSILTVVVDFHAIAAFCIQALLTFAASAAMGVDRFLVGATQSLGFYGCLLPIGK